MSGETKEIKVGDPVTFANNPINFPDRHVATVRYIDPDRDPGYLIEWDDASCGFYKLSELVKIKPEIAEVSKQKYTKGDKVWNKKHKEILWFVRYNRVNDKYGIFSHSKERVCEDLSRHLSLIEPYTGQDKEQTPADVIRHNIKVANEFLDEYFKKVRYIPDEITGAMAGVNLKRGGAASKVDEFVIRPVYYVILNSGSRIAVNETVARELIQLIEKKNPYHLLGYCTFFKLSEIAAIVSKDSLNK